MENDSTDKVGDPHKPVQSNIVIENDAAASNDIIGQTAQRHSGDSDHGDKKMTVVYTLPPPEEGDNNEEHKKGCCCCCWRLVFDPFFELFILICIIMNTVFMALDHHNMDRELERVLKKGNYFFTATFVVEAILKLCAMNPMNYFKQGWNIFDFTIVAFSVIELGLEGVQGLSILRSFRLLRTVRLAKYSSTFKHVDSTLGQSKGALRRLMFELCLVVFLFAFMGKQLFSKNYLIKIISAPEENFVRWNFYDFFHSMMIVIRTIWGEWIENMTECESISNVLCIPFFLATFVVGNLILLNVLSAFFKFNFGSSRFRFSSDQAASKRIVEAFRRIARFLNWIKSRATRGSKMQPSGVEFTVQDEFKNKGRITESTASTKDDENRDENDQMIENNPPKCLPEHAYVKFNFLADDNDSAFWKNWNSLRLKAFKLVKQKNYEIVILALILLNSLALAFEDVYLPGRPILKQALIFIDRTFIIIFFVEILIKLLGLGLLLVFTNGWLCFDFVVVMASVVNMIASFFGFGEIPLFQAMRVLYVLTPLRAVFRLQRLKIVVDTFVQALPSILRVLPACSILWLIFAIMGVQLFAGKFFQCVDENGISYEYATDRNTCISDNLTWTGSNMNFDHVGKAFLSLILVGTGRGWNQIMNDAVDSRDIDLQPIQETNLYMYLYFVFFIVFGAFFTGNIFIGSITAKFNEQQKKNETSEMCVADDHKKFFSGTKKIRSRKPAQIASRPEWRPQALIFDLVTSKAFDRIISLLIGLNLLTLVLDGYQKTTTMKLILNNVDIVFVFIFTAECLLKIFALRFEYFGKPWNLFDFAVVVVSIIGLVLSDLIEKYFAPPSLLRFARVAKAGNLLRLLKGTKGLRTLLYALVMSLPALVNIFSLLCLSLFTLALLGMSLFKHVTNSDTDNKYGSNSDFGTFGQSFITMFKLTRSTGWDAIMGGVMKDEDCDLPDAENGYTGNCGVPSVGVAFMFTYLVSVALLMFMVYSVILHNYLQATKEAEGDDSDDDSEKQHTSDVQDRMAEDDEP